MSAKDVLGKEDGCLVFDESLEALPTPVEARSPRLEEQTLGNENQIETPSNLLKMIRLKIYILEKRKEMT